MHTKKFLIFVITLLFAASNINAASTAWQEDQNSKSKVKFLASFYSDNTSENADKLIVGVHFKIPSGWKIYGDDQSVGINDGIGVAPSFDFTKSDAYSSHQTLWPKPEIGMEEVGKDVLKFSFYKDEVIIPIAISLKEISKINNISLQLNYGICKDVCVPVNQEFTLQVPQKIDENALQEIQKFLVDKTVIAASESKLDLESSPEKSSYKEIQTFLWIIVLGILGGMILNVMPCVLPVISIKLFSIIYAAESYRQRHETLQPSRVRLAFLSTIVGIMSCFAFFAIIAGVIKLTGNQLGWGFQFQNPHFLVFLIAILTIFTANLIGLFEFNFERVFSNFLNNKIIEIEMQEEAAQRKSIFLTNFISGILAVILATPCSAPFLGAAISFALANNFLVILTVFLSIGIGFSAPYILMIASPRLIEILPKPGAWMVQIKHLMTLMLVATIAWLIFVLSKTTGSSAAVLLVFCSIALLLSFKLKTNFLRFFAIAILLSSMFSTSFITNKTSKGFYDDKWWEFNEEEIHRQVALGNTVFIDITADWCITCKFNKKRVLEDKRVMGVLKGGNMVIMRGDITKPNEKIMQFIRSHDRFAIPFNVIYGPSAPSGLLTSEILSKREVFKLIAQASKKPE